MGDGRRLIIIFDLDNTLITNPYAKGVFPHIQRIMSERGKKKDYVRALLEESVRLRREGKLVESYDWDLIVRNVARSNRIQVRVDVADLVRKYNKPPYTSMEPGANGMLKSLQERGYRIVILTNGYEKFQLPVIESLGLVNYDLFVSADKIGFIKPQPEAFKLAAKPFLKNDSERPVVVGDSILFDVYGASLAGFRAIWRRRDKKTKTKSVRLLDFRSLVRRTARKEGLEGLVKTIPDLTVPTVRDLLEIVRLVREIEARSHYEF